MTASSKVEERTKPNISGRCDICGREVRLSGLGKWKSKLIKYDMSRD